MTDTVQGWMFSSNNVHVPICSVDNPHPRRKEDRRDHYVVNENAHRRHPVESHCAVGGWLATVL